jgi:hypothetical protein
MGGEHVIAQQMEFDEAGSEGQRSSFHGYESGYSDPFVESFEQKVSPQQADKGLRLSSV